MTPFDSTWTPERIKALRLFIGDSAGKFGARFMRSPRTVEDWEQGRRGPDALVIKAFDALAKRRKFK